MVEVIQFCEFGRCRQCGETGNVYLVVKDDQEYSLCPACLQHENEEE